MDGRAEAQGRGRSVPEHARSEDPGAKRRGRMTERGFGYFGQDQ